MQKYLCTQLDYLKIAEAPTLQVTPTPPVKCSKRNMVASLTALQSQTEPRTITAHAAPNAWTPR